MECDEGFLQKCNEQTDNGSVYHQKTSDAAANETLPLCQISHVSFSHFHKFAQERENYNETILTDYQMRTGKFKFFYVQLVIFKKPKLML